MWSCAAGRAKRDLLPWLTRGKSKRKFSETYTKSFAYYRRKHGCYLPDCDFHSFRTGWNTYLVGPGVQDSVCNYLMGHEESDAGIRKYLPTGVPLSGVREAVDSVEIDISAVRRPFARPGQERGGGLSVIDGGSRRLRRAPARPSRSGGRTCEGHERRVSHGRGAVTEAGPGLAGC